MAHPLKGKLSIDVDDHVGLGNLGGVRVEGKRIEVAFFEPIGAGGDAGRATPQELKTWREWGRLAGLRFVPNGWGWVSEMTGDVAAKKASDYITALEATERLVDVVEWDVETKNIQWQLDFLLGNATRGTKGIRGAGGKMLDRNDPSTFGYRWGRPGVWTMEGRQDTNTSVAHLAAQTGLLVGPQCYDGPMTEQWDLNFELLTWVENANPDHPHGANIPVAQILPFYDARRSLRPVGAHESVLFATSRLTELVG